jgi:hypothetical protein
MDTKEYRRAKEALETELAAYLNTRLREFQEETGAYLDEVLVQTGRDYQLGGTPSFGRIDRVHLILEL